MFAMNLDKLKVNEAELKAYIYQQLNDLQPYVGEIPVAIKMMYANDKFVVKILASHEAGEIEAQGLDENVFSAISSAKYALIKSLSAIDEVLTEDDEPHRDMQIQSILTNVTGKNHLH